jgi:hypothetical protein
LVHEIKGVGKGWSKFRTVERLFVTHHALVRSTQRWGVRTVDDLTCAVGVISGKAIKYICSRGENWLDVPPQGVRISENIAADVDITLVLQRYEGRNALLVVTLL